MDRGKLQTEIERNMHALINEVKEHVVDFTVLTVRRQYPQIDREQLAVILEIMRKGVDDGFMTKIDRFMLKLDKTLTELTSQENPLDGGTNKP